MIRSFWLNFSFNELTHLEFRSKNLDEVNGQFKREIQLVIFCVAKYQNVNFRSLFDLKILNFSHLKQATKCQHCVKLRRIVQENIQHVVVCTHDTSYSYPTKSSFKTIVQTILTTIFNFWQVITLDVPTKILAVLIVFLVFL